jgi:hypothetical protein
VEEGAKRSKREIKGRERDGVERRRGEVRINRKKGKEK